MTKEQNKKAPNLRFKGFTNDWEQRKLYEVADYRNGKAHEQHIYIHGNYIVVNSKFVSTSGKAKKYSDKLIEPLMKNEIAFVLSDVPNGKALARTFLVKRSQKYTLNQRVAGITPHPNMNSYFLFILMNRNPYFLKFDDGVGQTNLSKKDVEQFNENYPTKREQQKIGEIFVKLDSLLTLQQRKLELLKEIKKGLLQKMFADKSNFPILRFEGFHAEWEQRKLGDIIKVSGGVPFKPSDYISNGLATIPKSSVNESGKANLRDAKQVSIKFKSKQNSLVYNGDIITSLRDLVPTAPNLGRVVQIDGTRTVYILSQGVYSLKANSNYVTKQFMVEYSNTPRYRNEIYKIKNGSTQVHIRSGQYLNIAISIPNISEQVKVSKLLKIINISITLQQRRLTKLNSIKKSLLQQMFI